MPNTIYNTKPTPKKFHYTYQITEISTNKKYIGVRSSNIPPKNDLGYKYFSSSTIKKFIKNQKENKNNYIYEVLSIFESKNEAAMDEMRLHKLYDVAKSPEFYNRHNASSNKFNTSNKAIVKDKNGNISCVDVNDPRYLSGELIPHCKGLIPVRNVITGEMSTTTKDNIDYINGLLVHNTKGKIVVKDKDGNTMQVDQTDPRYLSGELISIHKGKVTVKDKDGNTFSVNVDDHRYLSGELVYYFKGMVPVRDIDGNTLSVSKDDPRYLSGELVSTSTNLLIVKDKNGNNVRFTSEEYKNQNELKFHTTNKTVVIDKNGKTLSVSIDDPRYLSGELVGIAKGKIAVKDIYSNRSMIYTNDERYNVSLFPCKSKLFKINNEICTGAIASKKYNISRHVVEVRAKSAKFPDWEYL